MLARSSRACKAPQACPACQGGLPSPLLPHADPPLCAKRKALLCLLSSIVGFQCGGCASIHQLTTLIKQETNAGDCDPPHMCFCPAVGLVEEADPVKPARPPPSPPAALPPPEPTPRPARPVRAAQPARPATHTWPGADRRQHEGWRAGGGEGGGGGGYRGGRRHQGGSSLAERSWEEDGPGGAHTQPDTHSPPAWQPGWQAGQSPHTPNGGSAWGGAARSLLYSQTSVEPLSAAATAAELAAAEAVVAARGARLRAEAVARREASLQLSGDALDLLRG